MMTNGKNKLKTSIFFWYIFSPDTRVCGFNNGTQDIPLRQFFLSRLDLFDSIFSGVAWINKLYDLIKAFDSLAIVAMEIGKR